MALNDRKSVVGLADLGRVVPPLSEPLDQTDKRHISGVYPILFLTAPPATPAINVQFLPDIGPARYSIWLLDQFGTPVQFIDRYIALEYALSDTDIGVLNLVLFPSFDTGILVEDMQLRVERIVPGAGVTIDGDAVWLVRDWGSALTSQGNWVKFIGAYSGMEWLDRPVIAYAEESAQAVKTGLPADDLMKAFVRENLGSLATNSSRDLSAYLDVEANLGQGPVVSKSASYRNLLSTLKEIQKETVKKGEPIFFDISKPGSKLTFATYKGQRGVDHSQSGNGLVILSPHNGGTLSDGESKYESQGERNVVYVGGAGQGPARIVQVVSDTSRTSVSPYNRREIFVSADQNADLIAEGEATLRANAIRDSLNVKIHDTRAVRYGREYGFGSKIVTDFLGKITTGRINAVQIISRNKRESIRAKFSAE